jgi:TPR repeat protein
MHNIGVLYQDGLGVPKDLGTAVPWYRREADLGSVNAKEALARLGR